jgi:hypothetical protein
VSVTGEVDRGARVGPEVAHGGMVGCGRLAWPSVAAAP